VQNAPGPALAAGVAGKGASASDSAMPSDTSTGAGNSST
jgi:hypothetical protein